ncbi:MAG: cytochrome b/b6 domain-containing protein [Paracoccaceae bacterium]
MKLAANPHASGLYALLIVMVVSGGLAWFGQQRWAAEAHEVLKALVLVLVGVHVLGALYQQIVLASDVMKRMGHWNEGRRVTRLVLFLGSMIGSTLAFVCRSAFVAGLKTLWPLLGRPRGGLCRVLADRLGRGQTDVV